MKRKIRELEAKNKSYEGEIQDLQERNQDLEKKIEDLKAVNIEIVRRSSLPSSFLL